MSRRFRFSCCVVGAVLVASAACGSAGSSSQADASIPIDLGIGTSLTIASTHDLGPELPAGAQAALASITAAADDPSGPMRVILDHLVAALPAGTARNVVGDLEPIVAAYLTQRITEIAPNFATGMQAIAQGTSVIAREFGTLETLRIDSTSAGTRRITDLRFAIGGHVSDLAFDAHGSADVVVDVGLQWSASNELTIANHVVPMPYGTLVRLGLDGAVIPSVDSNASDLGAALADLVACAHLAELVAGVLGVGTQSMYEAACSAGMAAIASEIYGSIAALDATPLDLEVSGAAVGGDRDGNGTLDTLTAGVWTGNVGYAGAESALVGATFATAP